jgi:xanthine dehydrogenase iron-sulfur cluster and FAD-binding subunit A
MAAKPKVSDEDVERILDGNLCRCTGYRPIIAAFKSFAANDPEATASRDRFYEAPFRPKSFRKKFGLCITDEKAYKNFR